MVDLTSGADSILVNTSIGAVSGMTVDWSEEHEGVMEVVGLAVQAHWLYYTERDQAVIVRVDKMSEGGWSKRAWCTWWAATASSSAKTPSWWRG